MYRSLAYSIILHGFILLLAIYGLPQFKKEQMIQDVITVEISNIGDITKLKRGNPKQDQNKKTDSGKQIEPQPEVAKQAPREIKPTNNISSDQQKKAILHPLIQQKTSPQQLKQEEMKRLEPKAEIKNKPKNSLEPKAEDRSAKAVLDEEAINLENKKNKEIKQPEKLEKNKPEAKTQNKPKTDKKTEPKPVVSELTNKQKIKKEIDAKNNPEPNKSKENKSNKIEQKTDPADNKQKSVYSDAILKSLEQPSSKEKPQQSSANSDLDKIIDDAIETGEKNAELNDTDELSLSEKDAIVSQISKAWNMSAFSGNKSRGEMRVRVLATLDRDGNVLNAKPQIDSSQAGDPSYVAFVNSAVRAFYAASPLQGLLDKNYELWREIDLGFDASGVIN